MRIWIMMIACVACTTGGAETSSTGSQNIGALPTVEATGSDPPTVANIVDVESPTNLIVNGGFENYTDPNVPASWSVDEIYGYRGMYTPTDGWIGRGVRFVRNAQGRHLLSQDVRVEPNHRYTVQVVYWVVATDWRRGGLYVVDPASGTLIAGDDTNRPSNGWRIASVTFDSGSRTRVAVKIGYVAGLNGTVLYDGVAMFEESPALHYRYQKTYRDVIGIPAQSVHDLVPQLADYVTTLLAAPYADRMAHRDAYAAYLPYYLYQFLSAPEGSRASWCQRSSLALAEVLAMYGVRTRQIHIASPQHEFLEYFDGKKWAVFDSYFGIRYVLAGVRLAFSEVVAAGIRKVSIEIPTHERVFYLELGYLIPIWDAGVYTPGIDMP